jgi:hypothetical protein
MEDLWGGDNTAVLGEKRSQSSRSALHLNVITDLCGTMVTHRDSTQCDWWGGDESLLSECHLFVLRWKLDGRKAKPESYRGRALGENCVKRGSKNCVQS